MLRSKYLYLYPFSKQTCVIECFCACVRMYLPCSPQLNYLTMEFAIRWIDKFKTDELVSSVQNMYKNIIIVQEEVNKLLSLQIIKICSQQIVIFVVFIYLLSVKCFSHIQLHGELMEKICYASICLLLLGTFVILVISWHQVSLVLPLPESIFYHGSSSLVL